MRQIVTTLGYLQNYRLLHLFQNFVHFVQYCKKFILLFSQGHREFKTESVLL